VLFSATSVNNGVMQRLLLTFLFMKYKILVMFEIRMSVIWQC